MAAPAESKGCGRDLVSLEVSLLTGRLAYAFSGTVEIGLRVRVAKGTLSAPMCMLFMFWVREGLTTTQRTHAFLNL